MICATEVKSIADRAPLAAGYRFELMRRTDIPALVGCVRDWYPDINVGGASRYLREQFYCDEVLFTDDEQHDNIVLLLKQEDELVGMFASEFDCETQSVYAALGDRCTGASRLPIWPRPA